jgi:uncharacterized repeat protein (TIGR02543 family)
MYDHGEVVDITATPDEGWQFDGWTGDVADPLSAKTEFTVSSNGAITAKFSPSTCTVNLEVEGKGSTDPALGPHLLNQGDVMNIAAFPEEHWQFDCWKGDVTNSESSVTTLVADSDKAVTANFSPIVHSISFEIEGSGFIEPGTGAYEYNEGDVIDIKAIPDDGWQFDGWTGGVSDPQSADTSIVVNADHTFTAKFSKVGFWDAIRILYSTIIEMFISLGK